MRDGEGLTGSWWISRAACLGLLWGAALWLRGPASAVLVLVSAGATLWFPLTLVWRTWSDLRSERNAEVKADAARIVRAERRLRAAVMFAAFFLPACLLLFGAATTRGKFHQTDPKRRENLEPDPYLGHRVSLLPEQSAAGLGLEGTVGQRLERPDSSRKQVVLLGDSVLYGWGVRDDESPGPALSRHVKGVQVLNASVSGYSLDQYLLYLRQILPQLNPAVIVIGVFAGNDYESCGSSQWHGHSKPVFLPEGESGLKIWREETPWYDCVDVLSGSLLWTLLWRSPEFGEAVLRAICRPLELPVDVHEEVIRRTFAALAALAEERGAHLLFVLLPDRNDFCTENVSTTKVSKHGRLASLLEEGALDVLIPREEWELTCDQACGIYLENDSAHFTVEGLEMLASLLARELELRYGVR